MEYCLLMTTYTRYDVLLKYLWITTRVGAKVLPQRPLRLNSHHLGRLCQLAIDRHGESA